MLIWSSFGLRLWRAGLRSTGLRCARLRRTGLGRAGCGAAVARGRIFGCSRLHCYRRLNFRFIRGFRRLRRRFVGFVCACAGRNREAACNGKHRLQIRSLHLLLSHQSRWAPNFLPRSRPPPSEFRRTNWPANVCVGRASDTLRDLRKAMRRLVVILTSVGINCPSLCASS